MRRARSTFSLFAAITVSAALVVGCSSSGGGSSDKGTNSGGGDSPKDPIRIGLLTPATGAYAGLGELNRNGVQLAVDEVNAAGGVDGRKVEVFKADTGGTPAGAVTSAQKLVEQDKVQFLIGTVSTAVTTAVTQKVPSLGVLQVISSSQGIDLTGKDCNANTFRVNANDGMATNAINAWLEKQPNKAGTWDIMAADYAYGHETAAAFKAELGKNGGKVNSTLYSPVGTTDFGSYLAQFKGGDGLLIVLSGTDIINFYKQALQFGTMDKYKAAISGPGGLIAPTLKAVGDKLIGQLGVTFWSPAVPTDATKKFTDAYMKAYSGALPDQFAAQAYSGAQFIFAAVKAAGAVDPMKVAKAMEGLSFDSLFGKVTMREGDHQMLVPTYVSEVVQTDNGLGWKTLISLPAEETTPNANPACKLK